MVYPQLEEKLHHARHALKGATSENIIELCKQYLAPRSHPSLRLSLENYWRLKKKVADPAPDVER